MNAERPAAVALGTTDVVATLVAGSAFRRMTMPVAVIRFTAAPPGVVRERSCVARRAAFVAQHTANPTAAARAEQHERDGQRQKGSSHDFIPHKAPHARNEPLCARSKCIAALWLYRPARTEESRKSAQSIQPNHCERFLFASIGRYSSGTYRARGFRCPMYCRSNRSTTSL